MAKILVIDDDDVLRGILRQYLELSGYDVIDTNDAGEAPKILREQPCDLVITDIFMPNQDGIETIIHLKAEFPELKIVAMSGGGSIGSLDYLQQAEELGADRTFTKPLDTDKFLSGLKDLLS